MEAIRDLARTVRALRRRPGFTAVAVLCLAVGVGAATSVFSLANGLLLKPLPGIGAPGELVRIDGFGSPPSFIDLERSALVGEVFTSVAAFLDRQVALEAGGEPRAVLGQLVSGDYFRTLRTEPALGRLLTREDDEALRAVAVVGHRLWLRELGGDPNAVGRTIRLNGAPFRLVGVAPEGFLGTFVGFRFDVWVPLSTAPTVAPGFDLDERGTDRLEMIARLREGATPAAARAGVERFARTLEEAHPVAHSDLEARVAPLTGFDPGARRAVLGLVAVLLSVAGLVLATACINVTNLLLARGLERRRELGVHFALGAGRGRVARTVLAESLGLAAVGGGGGLLLAWWAVDFFPALVPPLPFDVALDFSLDWRVVVFTCAVVLLAGLGAGLLPALRASRADVRTTMASPAGFGARGGRARSVLVAGQVAASMVLLVIAGLFLRTLDLAARTDPGFEADGVQIAPLLDLRLLRADEAEGAELFDRMIREVERVPGVERAAVAGRMPLRRAGTVEVRVPGRPGPPGQVGLEVGVDEVSPGFFETLGVPLLRGRPFLGRDREGSPGVAIVNRALARRFWPGEEGAPVGRRLIVGDREVEIVGLAGNLRYESVSEPAGPFLYLPLAQSTVLRRNLILRTAGGAPVAAADVRNAVQEAVPGLPVPEVTSLRRHLGIGFTAQRIAASVSGALGVLGLGLAAIGLYGLTAFSVRRRRREIGVRMALGASRAGVTRMVVRGALGLSLAGILVGGALAAGTGAALEALLYGVAPADPLTFTVVAGLLLATAVLGSLAPAYAASRIDPMEVLREE